jgi:hypothetical protein
MIGAALVESRMIMVSDAKEGVHTAPDVAKSDATTVRQNRDPG